MRFRYGISMIRPPTEENVTVPEDFITKSGSIHISTTAPSRRRDDVKNETPQKFIKRIVDMEKRQIEIERSFKWAIRVFYVACAYGVLGQPIQALYLKIEKLLHLGAP